MTARRLLPALALLLLAVPALASGGGEEGGGGLLYPTINFLLLIAVLVYFARTPIQTFFAERRSGIRSEIDEASRLKQEAEARYAKWQRRLVDLERELEEIRATARERAETEREHILADARAAGERIRRDATTAIEQEVRRARERLREEASALAVEAAAGMLRDQVGPADRERLIDEFIARVEEAPRATNGGGS